MTTPAKLADQIIDLMSRLDYEMRVLAKYQDTAERRIVRRRVKNDLLDILKPNTDKLPTKPEAT